jgi:hypothetical protein
MVGSHLKGNYGGLSGGTWRYPKVMSKSSKLYMPVAAVVLQYKNRVKLFNFYLNIKE